MLTPIEHAIKRFDESGESFMKIERRHDLKYREYFLVSLSSGRRDRGYSIAEAIDNAFDDEQAANEEHVK